MTGVSEELTAIITLMMEAVSSSKTSVNIYQTTRCYIPEDSNLHNLRREKQNPTNNLIWPLWS
jgi:hypothetical protein